MSSQQSQQSAAATTTVLATLQPIRDLAANWDIPIASCLEEYLHELGHDVVMGDDFDMDDPSSLFNFAEAALVLQNSSQVYSAKVEYLYRLVYQALQDFASATGTPRGQQAGKRGGAAVEWEALDAVDPELQFLPLDDVVPVDDSDSCRLINLKDGGAERVQNSTSLSLTNLETGRSGLGATASSSSQHSTAAMTARTHRALMGSLDSHSLRLVDAHADVDDATGVLLLPGAAAGASSSQKYTPRSSTNPNDTTMMVQPHQQDEDGFPTAQDDNDDPPIPFDDGDDGGFAFAMDDDDIPGEENRDPAPKEAEEPAPKASSSTIDPWLLLDPHETGSRKKQPLRIGKTIQLPATLQLLPSECVTGARTKRRAAPAKKAVDHNNKTTTSLATETFRATLQAARKRTHQQAVDDDDGSLDDDSTKDTTANESLDTNKARPVVPLKGLVFGNEFAYIAKATAKRKAAERRERRKRQAAVEAGEAAAKEEGDNGQAAAFQDYDDDGFVAAFDDGDDDDFGAAAEDENRQALNNTGGVLSVDQVYNASDALEDSWNGANLDEDGRTFEELCRAHISNFRRGAEKYASETQLSQRVGHWQEKLAPLLEQEEQRPVFDIHEYGQTVLATMEQDLDRQRQSSKKDDDDGDSASSPSTIKKVNFCEVTRHAPQYQVCRLFLAALSLSNSGNVQLSTEGGSDEDEDTVGVSTNLIMELLTSSSSVLEHQSAMEHYLAPSVAAEN